MLTYSLDINPFRPKLTGPQSHRLYRTTVLNLSQPEVYLRARFDGEQRWLLVEGFMNTFSLGWVVTLRYADGLTSHHMVDYVAEWERWPRLV